MKGYTQLAQKERYQLYSLKKAGHSQREIPVTLTVVHQRSTRELKRYKGLKGYRPKQAHRLAGNESE